MFVRCSLKLGNCPLRETRPIGGARIKRGHPAALPAEDRFKLCDRRAVFSRACRSDLTNTVRGLCDTGLAASHTKHVAEGLL